MIAQFGRLEDNYDAIQERMDERRDQGKMKTDRNGTIEVLHEDPKSLGIVSVTGLRDDIAVVFANLSHPMFWSSMERHSSLHIPS